MRLPPENADEQTQHQSGEDERDLERSAQGALQLTSVRSLRSLL